MSRAWILMSVVAACGGNNMPPPQAGAGAPAVPAWVDKNPEQKGKLCALGTAEPTFYREDGKIYAAENARAQLAQTLSVRVESVMVDIQTTSGQDVDQQYVMQAQSFATDTVLAGAQIVSYWFDDTGVRGRKNATYAFACLDTNMSVADLNKRLEQAYPKDKDKNQAVRDRAKASFDALEKEEEKRGKK